MTLKVGALFAGMGGLELGLAQVLDVEPAWFSEVDAAPSAILAHHWPHVPNHGDITKVRWADVEPVDIITGGSPCQDLSHAGKRAGMKAGTRSGLWASMCDAIETVHPSLVVWENVRGALSAEADSAVEPCPVCMGDGGRVTLRALGRVLGDLAELGYDAAWCGLRAADVGAPHGRFRVFVLAWPAAAADRLRLQRARRARDRRHGPTDGRQPAVTLLPTPATPTTQPANLGAEARALLPTPRATDGTKGGPNQRGSSGDLMLPSAVQLLPTPTAMDSNASGGKVGSANVTLTDATERGDARGIDFGDYAPAIARWEAVLGRPAPAPTEPTGRDGAHRLSPRFVEHMMGLPAGWVDVPGVGRNAQLKALGNGVVPQQAAAAIAHLLDVRAGVTGEAAA